MKSVVQVFSLGFLSKVLLGLTGILLIRFMPSDEYADYTLALSLAAVATHLLATGFNMTYIVGYRRLNLANASSSFMTLQIVALAGLAVLAWPFAHRTQGLYWLVLVLISATCLVEFSRTYFQQELRFLRYSMIELVRALTLLGAVSILALMSGFHLTVSEVLIIQAATLLAVFTFAFGRCLVLSDVLKIQRAISWVRTIVQGDYRYLFGYTLILALITQTDILMLKMLADETSLATYGSAFRYYTFLSLVLGAVHAVLMPVIQTMRTAEELDALFRRHRRLLMAFTPAVIIGAGTSGWIIPLIDMGKYPDAVTVFRILAASSIISCALAPHVNVILRFEDFRFLCVLTGVAFIVGVGLNIALITHLGAIGAALATLVVFSIINGTVFIRARRFIRTLWSSSHSALGVCPVERPHA